METCDEQAFFLALSPFAMDETDCDSQQLFYRPDLCTIESPAPAQIMRQVARGQAAKATEPLTPTLVTGVDVLDVQRNGDSAYKIAR